MVTDAIINIFSNFLSFLVGLISVPAAPEFLGDIGGYLDTASSYVSGTGYWIPWAILSAVFAAWAIALVAMVTIKGIRIVASFLTLGGGSAA